MNTGFSNLDTLKQHLLAPALRPTVTYDVQLADLGLGIARQIENFCNRKFSRLAEVEIQAADRVRFMLRRFPVETVSLVELKLAEATGWKTLDAPPWNILQTIDQQSGILIFPDGNDVGPDYAQVRFTYTGGFWWELDEPDDDTYPNTMPAGATVLPDDLRYAWLLQCKHVWQTIDPRGVKIVGEGDKTRVVPQQVFGDMDFIPQVVSALRKYQRLNLT